MEKSKDLALALEAGGRVTDWQGNEWKNKNLFVLASNGYIHNDIVQHVREV